MEAVCVSIVGPSSGFLRGSRMSARMSKSRSHLLRRGMTIAQCNNILGANWSDEKYDRGRGLHRVYEAIAPGGIVGTDLYFRHGRLTRWWGDVDNVVAHVAAAR